MSTIVTRAGKGSALTWAEADANFTNLNTDKAETASPTFTGTPTAPTATNGTNTTQLATTAFVQGKTATQTPFTPAGSIIATNVQSAIQEVNSEKLSLTGGTVTGVLAISGLSSNMQIKAGSESPVSSIIQFATDGSGWQSQIGTNVAGTYKSQLTFLDAGPVLHDQPQGSQASALTRKDYVDAPLFYGINNQMGIASNNTSTKLGIELAGIQIDSNSWWNSTSKRYIPQRAGYYRATVFVSGNATTEQQLTVANVAKNGSIGFDGTSVYGASLANVTDMRSTDSMILYMNGTTDYIEPYGRIVGTGTLTLGKTSLEIEFIRP